MITATTITRPQLELLVGVVERGPFQNFEVADKDLLEDLIKEGLLVRICANGQDSYVAATHCGRNVYCMRFDSLSLEEAMGKRMSLVRAA